MKTSNLTYHLCLHHHENFRLLVYQRDRRKLTDSQEIWLSSHIRQTKLLDQNNSHLVNTWRRNSFLTVFTCHQAKYNDVSYISAILILTNNLLEEAGNCQSNWTECIQTWAKIFRRPASSLFWVTTTLQGTTSSQRTHVTCPFSELIKTATAWFAICEKNYADKDGSVLSRKLNVGIMNVNKRL